MSALRSSVGRWNPARLVLLPALFLTGGLLPGTQGAAQSSREAEPRGWLGVNIVATEARAEGSGEGAAPRSPAFVVRQVFEDGPAARAGIEPGDVIVGIDGVPARPLLLRERLGPGLTPGMDLTLTIQRDGEDRTVRVEAGVAPDSLFPRQRGTASGPGRRTLFPNRDPIRPGGQRRLEVQREALERAAWLPPLLGRNVIAGAAVVTLNAELARYFPVAEGVLVTDVIERSPAGDAGLAPGDVVVSVAGEPVTRVEELRAALFPAPAPGGGSVALEVVRMRERLRLSLPLPR